MTLTVFIPFQMNGVDVTSLTHMQIVTLATSNRELRLLIKPIEQPQQQGLYLGRLLHVYGTGQK